MEFAIYTISIKGFFSKRYEIYQDERLVYRVDKPSFFDFREMNLTDAVGNQILKINRNLALFFVSYRFVISQEGKSIATVVKNGIENFYSSTSIYGDHTIQGDFFNSEFTIYNDEDEVAKVSRKRLRSKNKYGIAIIKGNNELYILAMVIAISIVNSRGKKKG